jgi:hypothetical protein
MVHILFATTFVVIELTFRINQVLNSLFSLELFRPGRRTANVNVQQPSPSDTAQTGKYIQELRAYENTIHKFNADECLICLDRFDEIDITAHRNDVFLHCGHKFHEGCIKQLLMAKNSRCPVCRDALRQNAAVKNIFL